LIRNPYDNVVARFRYERKYNNAIGFSNWCPFLDTTYNNIDTQLLLLHDTYNKYYHPDSDQYCTMCGRILYKVQPCLDTIRIVPIQYKWNM
jgi:hypothetical protein